MTGCNNVNRRGAALVLISVAMVAVGLLGSAMLAMSTAARRQRLDADVGSQAYYLAESGRSYAYSRRSGDMYYVPAGSFVMESGDLFMLESAIDGTNLLVTSRGIANPGGHRESSRSVRFQMAYNPIVAMEDVFVWAQQLTVKGAGDVSGRGGSIVLTGDLVASDITGATDLDVTTIFVDGDVRLVGAGTVSLGSSAVPGNIYIAGDLDLLGGTPKLHGDIHVGGTLRIANGTISGNMYVHGNVEYHGSSFSLVGDSRIYYAGALINWPTSGAYADKAVAVDPDALPPLLMPDDHTPLLRDPRPGWYTDRGYMADAPLANNLRVYTSEPYTGTSSAALANVVIVSEGDISITMSGNREFIGVLIAPNGSVTFSGKRFEGMVIAGEGFLVDAGSPDVTFRSITEFFSDPDDYPVLIE